MKQYMVHSGNEILKIIADRVSFDSDELRFYRNDEIVACFTSWQYWIFEGTKVKNENKHS